MKTFKAVTSYIFGLGLVVMIITRIIFVAGGSNTWDKIAFICLALIAMTCIIRVMVALITDETFQRLLSAVTVFALLFIFDYAMSQLFAETWRPSQERLSRVISTFLLLFVLFGGMVKLVYNLYTPFGDEKRRTRGRICHKE